MAGRKLLISLDELNRRTLDTGRVISCSRPKPKRSSDFESEHPPFILDDLPDAPYYSKVELALEDLLKIRRFPFIRRVADGLYIIGSGTFSIDGGTNSIGWKLLPYAKLRAIPADILLDHASAHEESGTVVVHLLRAPSGSIITMWVHRVEGKVSRDIPGKRWRLVLDDSERGWHPNQMQFEMEPTLRTRLSQRHTD
jgi:hypothetical protein